MQMRPPKINSKFSAFISIIALVWVCLFQSIAPLNAQNTNRIATSGNARQAILRNQARVSFYLNDHGTALGRPILLRLIRNTKKLELYAADRRGNFRFIRYYNVCGRANNLAQTPMGIYKITASGLASPNRDYLQISVNFPNPYQVMKRVRGNLDIQARCNTGEPISLTDTEMEELFTIVYAAIGRGQNEVPLYIHPFELSAINVFSARNDPNNVIIRQLETIFSRFQSRKAIPNVRIDQNGYNLIIPNKKAKK